MRRIATVTLPARVRAISDIRITTVHKLTAILFLMVLAASLNAILLKSLTHDFRDMAGTVSMAGKLRLLSQRLEFDVMQFTADPARSADAVLNGMAEFDMVLDALLRGGQIFGINVSKVSHYHHATLDDVHQKWDDYRHAIQTALNYDGPDMFSGSVPALYGLREQLSKKAILLLHASEHMVDSIVKDMQQRQRTARWHMYMTLFAIITSFVAALWFLRRRIYRPLTLLYDGACRAEQGDYNLHVHYSCPDEIGRLVEVFNRTAKRLGTKLYDLEDRNVALWNQARFDGLTELPNRTMLEAELESAMETVLARGRHVAFAYLDLDNFREINHSYGHQLGDTLLQHVAARIKGCVRDSDTVGRMGGDEFIILMADVSNPDIISRICERVLVELATPFAISGETINVTASIGVTLFPQDGCTATDMFRNADMARYEAKALGGNQYCWFKAFMQEKLARRQRLGRELTQALEQQQFTLMYQPIVDLRSSRVYKAEALIRWNHPERGLIGPGEFIPFAEDSGVIDVIGDWVFETAARQVAQWRSIYDKHLQVSINVSPVQFSSEEPLPQRWFDHLESLELDGRSVVIEITEGLLMDASGAVKRRLRAFRERGMQIALDDFGTGYSSLSYLKKFDIDYIKIDRSFVSNLGPDTDERALCDAMIAMAHRLGLKVVAEGVETAEQYRYLLEAGCDFGQGYLFGRAMTEQDLASLLQQQRSVMPALEL